jgi:hypothetical protein
MQSNVVRDEPRSESKLKSRRAVVGARWVAFVSFVPVAPEGDQIN